MNQKQEIYNAIMESVSKVVYKYIVEAKDNRPKVKWIPFNKENVDKFKADDNELGTVKLTKKIHGWIIITDNERSPKLVGFIACDDNKVVAHEVLPKFRNMKFATKLLKKAVKDGCTEILVVKNNRPAIGMYFKNGFYIYGSNKTHLFMKLRVKKES